MILGAYVSFVAVIEHMYPQIEKLEGAVPFTRGLHTQPLYDVDDERSS